MATLVPSTTSSSSDLSKPAPLPQTRDHIDEKDVVGKENGEAPAEALGRELSRIDTSDFPSAFPLAMITIALMLSIFLCALGKIPSISP